MIAGVAVFIIGYTTLTGCRWFQRKVSGTSFGNALRLATRIRSTLAAVGLIGSLGWIVGLKLSFLQNLALLEVYAGLFAGQIVEAAGKIPWVRSLRIVLTDADPSVRFKSWWVGDMNSAVPIFLWTLTEGIILSLLMGTIAVLIWFTAKFMHR